MFRHTLFYALNVYFHANCSVENYGYIFDLALTCEVNTYRKGSPLRSWPAEHTSVHLEEEEEMRVRGSHLWENCIPTVSEKTETKSWSRCRKAYGAKLQCAPSSSLHFWEQKELVCLQWLMWL